ncbi:hypothetical protein UlMin_019435 [Ulmus minor]
MHARHRSPGNGYRSGPPPFNRGGATALGRSKSFQQSPPRKGDIFLEAGRLAAEYLVSQGFLPPTVLSANWQNGKFGQEGRTSALARLGNDAGSSRRRFSPPSGFKPHLKGRSYRGYGSDWGRDYNRNASASFQERMPRASSDIDARDDTLAKDDLASKNEEPFDSDKQHFPDDMDSKPTSSAAFKHPSETAQEPEKPSDDLRNSNAATGKMKDSDDIDETEKPSKGDSSCNNTADSLTPWKFAKVPTRIRSSLTSKTPKVDPPRANEEEKASQTVSPGENQALVAEGSPVDSSNDTLVHKTDDQSAQSVENVREVIHVYDLEPSSNANTSFVCNSELESCQGSLGFGSCSSLGKERGEKRDFEDSDTLEGAKRPRPTMFMEANELSNLSEKKLTSQEDGSSCGEGVTMPVAHENNSHFPKDGGDQCVEFAQEKQFFPSSFKICDLNLMGVSDAHENHDGDAIIMYPAISEMKREASPLDIDLSISNSNISGDNSRRPVIGKEIEVIDLENDSAPEDKPLDIGERKTETIYTDLDSFSNHPQNASNIPDVQDGYGLMISELLGNDFSNCSSVQADMNTMHNNIGLPNEEGTLGDDDSIYMSLGEIPLTFLRPWEQPPPQEYEKPF